MALQDYIVSNRVSQLFGQWHQLEKLRFIAVGSQSVKRVNRMTAHSELDVGLQLTLHMSNMLKFKINFVIKTKCLI